MRAVTTPPTGWREFDVEQAVLHRYVEKVKQGDRDGVTIQEIATDLQCAKSTVHRWINKTSTAYVTRKKRGRYVPTVRALAEALNLELKEG